MLLPIKPILDRRPRRDGTCNISIQYCFSSERRTVLPTNLAIPARYWNKKRMCISSDLPSDIGNADQMNLQLLKMIRTTEDIVSFAFKQQIKDPLIFLKQTFLPEIDTATLLENNHHSVSQSVSVTANNTCFFNQFDDYIRAKSRKVSVGMLRSYEVIKRRLLAFEKYRKEKITFNSFDYNFYEALVNYLTFEHIHKRRKDIIRGLKKNSVGTTIKQLRVFLHDRGRRKIIPPIDLTDYKIMDEETDAIYLTTQEIRKLYHFDLSQYPHLVRFRDIFVLGSLTGLRFSDFSSIKPEDIRNELLYKKQRKSDHWVVIPLRPEANEILINRFNRIVPKTTNEELNRYIKQIGKLAGIDVSIKISHKKGNQDIVIIKPKYELITTHTCRRSFCTNEFLAGTPPELIMKISGHKSVKDFYKYIRIAPEEAAQKIREIWQKRGDLNTIQEPEN